jgi:uncharacterized protein (DUF302 family)
MAEYTYRATVQQPLAGLRPVVEAALKAEGFGVLTEIDVAATLKAKLDLDRPPYHILGACNPGLANRALDADPSIGALLPCNVVLRQGSSPDETVVEILDPLAALGIAGEAVEPVAAEAAERLKRVMAAISG